MDPQTEVFIVGLHGPRRVGKDTIAEYLVEQYGFESFSFSDALYREVAVAYENDGVGPFIEWLKRPEVKDTDQSALRLERCREVDFAYGGLFRGETDLSKPRSPREILNMWGTEYRRAQDPDYWVKRADAWLSERLEAGVRRFVNTSVRFPNERAWVDSFRAFGARAEVWHVERPSAPIPPSDHVCDLPLPKRTGDRLIINGAGIDELRTGVTLLLGGNGIVNTTAD